MGIYRIFQSFSLQGFIDSCSDLLVSSSLLGPSLYLVVQNKSMGEWLKLKLAEKRGISAGCSAVLPEKAMRELAEGYACVRKLRNLDGEDGKEDRKKALPVFYLDNLKIRIYKILEGFAVSEGDVPENCRELLNYVKAFQAEDELSKRKIRSGRLYELADSMAGLLSHYGMNCGEMTGYWDKGQPFPGIPEEMKKHEDWQRYFWKLAYEGGLPLSAVLKAVEESEDCWDGNASSTGPVERVVLFGSSFLGDRALRFFQRLSRDVPVDHFILTPSKYYNLEERTCGGAKNPLLESWCTQMDGFASLAGSMAQEKTEPEGSKEEGRLTGKISCEFHNLAVSPSEGYSLLGKIQKDILQNTIPNPSLLGEEIKAGDSSLEIHGFPGPWRETEVLRDMIHNALNDTPDLRLTDIAVLAPDINIYAPYLEALFPSGDPRLDLPFNVIDLNNSTDSPLNQGFLMLLNLPGGRFTRTELFALFDNPCFCEACNLTRIDRESWLKLCEELNIKWGYDAKHKQNFFKDASDFNTWSRAFQRIKEGLFYEEEDQPHILPSPPPDEETGRSWSLLLKLAESLYHDLYKLDRMKMKLTQWVFLVEALLESYFQPRRNHRQDERDWMALKGCFRDILNMAEETPLPEEGRRGACDFDWLTFRTILKEFIHRASGSRGRYLTQGITCSSLKPMRAIPFRRIYILGMNEGVFPREEKSPSFDLRPFNEQNIDLSLRGGDLYAFLETLLGAGERLCLSYQSRDAQRGETLQPSPVITELLDYMENRFIFPSRQTPRQALFREERIHGFLPSGFDGSGRYPSFDALAFESARIYQACKENLAEDTPSLKLLRVKSTGAGKDSTASVPEERKEQGEPENLSLESMLSYLKNPVSWYFRKVQGIYPEGENSPELDSLENMNLEFPDTYRYLQQRLEEPGKLDAGPDGFLIEQTRRGRLTDGDFSFIDREALESRLGKMAARAKELKLEKLCFLNLLIDPEHCMRKEPSSLKAIKHPRVIRQLRNGERFFRFSLSGELRSLAFDEDGRQFVKLEYCASEKPEARHDFEAFLAFLTLGVLEEKRLPGFNTGLPSPKTLKLVRMGRQAYPPRLFSTSIFGQKNPQDVLDRLASLCLDSREILPLYPLLGEHLAKSLIKNPAMNKAALLGLWEQCWEKEAGNSWGKAPFHSCYYRPRYLPSVPQVNAESLRELLELVYVPLAGGYKHG